MITTRLPSVLVAFFMVLSVLVSSGCMQDDSSKDSDNDGHSDKNDAFPDDPDEWVDSDGDGIGDNSDEFPEDPNEWTDSDYDGLGDNADAFRYNPFETKDTDGDGVGDNADAFPEDPEEWADWDDDGVGDNADAFPENPFETKDTDGDGVGDNSDPFPEDPAEWADSDGDGVGDNADAFPNNPFETEDTDGDGIGDNSDPFPEDPTEWADSDDDGLANNYEDSIGTDPYKWDTDGDGLSDYVETGTGIWESGEATGTDPLDEDSDDDGLVDGRESNSGNPVWDEDSSWEAPTDVNEPYEPKDIFIETELKVNVVFIGAELNEEDKTQIADLVHNEYIPLNHIMETFMTGSNFEPIGVEYDLNLSVINAPEELATNYSQYLNESATRNWTVGSYRDYDGTYYVDEAFDEAFGEDDYRHMLVNGIDVYDAESWLYWNVPEYEGMEDIYDGYVIYFLLPDADEVWPYYYYSEGEDIDTGEEAVANNLMAYGGNYPFYFIDLMAPPPHFGQGFRCEDDCANSDNNPPIWLMEEDEVVPLISEYIEEAIQFLFVPSYIYTPEYEYEYKLDLLLIDATSDDSVYDDMTDYFNAANVQMALDWAVPYSEWTFNIEKADLEEDFLADYREALESTTQTISCPLGGDAQIIDSEVLIPEADKLVTRPDGVVTIPVFVTIFDDCGWVDREYVMGSAKAYSDGTPFGVFMATGKELLEYDGLTGTVVHELGHMLGLMHPHQSFGYDTGQLGFEQDWFWDQTASTMTYYHSLENSYLDSFNYDVLDRGHALVILADVQEYRYKIWTEIENKGYDYDTLPNDLFQLIVEIDYYWNMSIDEFERRNYFSYYSTGYDSVKLALKALEKAEQTLQVVQEMDSSVPKIWTDLGTDPHNPDTDGDGLLDGVETMTWIWLSDNETGTNPLNSDSDDDGLSDGEEVKDMYTDPTNQDTDYDGLSDGTEIYDTHTDPNLDDTDGDELLDGVETNTSVFKSENNTGSDPLNYDTDGDGVGDGAEVIYWESNPNLLDTDGDGYNDFDDYWPTFDLQIYITITYYNVENTDVWTEDDVYFWVSIEDGDWELTDTVVDDDENHVNYTYSHDANDDESYFYFWVEAWDDDGEGADDDQYDIDGGDDEDARLFLFYYPYYGWVGGDANHAYIGESEDGGWTLVLADGADDGDDDYHDAEVMLLVGYTT
ncbi:MAG: hypothetical protein VX898_04720 [Candidatus Thermoplasmatota archaeon]|nr:hypothetical protein [Candidatus Thermoplasmatota archaeon]